MKSITKLGGIFLMMFLLTASLQAQKFGYLNSAGILSLLPEVKQAESTLEVEQKMYQEKGKKMVEDLRMQYADVQKKEQEGTISRKQLEEEANKLRLKEEEIGKFEQEIMQKIQTKRAELLQPILDKVNDAIQAVAKENGFQFIFDAGPGSNILLYADESQDVSKLVMDKLGINLEDREGN